MLLFDINVDIYGLTCPAQRDGGLNLLWPLFLLKKYKTTIDDVRWKSRNPEPKKWGLFAIVEIYSSGVKMTLKVWFTAGVAKPVPRGNKVPAKTFSSALQTFLQIKFVEQYWELCNTW